MANFKQFTGIGTLTRDVEVKYLQSGQAVGNVSIAINEKYTTKSGEKKEDVLFLECVLWGKTAELAGEYLGKGKQVLFGGKLKQENWEDKNGGGKRAKIVLNVDTMQFLGSPGGSQEAPTERKPAPARQSKPVQRDFYDEHANNDGDVPF